MSPEEFKAWERKCLAEAVTNAARLGSRRLAAATASKPGAAKPAARQADAAHRPDPEAAPKQEG